MNWYKLLKFAGIKTFSYKLPDDLRERMYDFYMFSVLPRTDDIYAQDALKQVEDVLKTDLKNHLLNVVFFAVVAELRHVFDRNKIDELIYVMKQKQPDGTDNSKYIPFLETYHNNYKSLITERGRLSKEDIKQIQQNYSKYGNMSLEYLFSLKATDNAMKETDTDPEQVMKLASELFYSSMRVNWQVDYGGSIWARVADSWSKLKNAKMMNELMVYMDHVYDLQHNTNTIFNKMSSYYHYDNGPGCQWLTNALDHKAQIQSPYELLAYVSRPMRKLAPYILHQHYGADKPVAVQDFYSSDLSSNLKETWKKWLLYDPKSFNRMPYELKTRLFSATELADIVEIYLKDALHSFYMFAAYVPDELKKIFWGNKSTQELIDIFKPSLEAQPTYMTDVWTLEHTGIYNPMKLFSLQELKNMWVNYFSRRNLNYPTIRYYKTMPENLKKMLSEKEKQEIILWHIRELWSNIAQTQVDRASLRMWDYFSPDIKNKILENYAHVLEKIVRTAAYQKIVNDDKDIVQNCNVLNENIKCYIVADEIFKILKNLTDTNTRSEYWNRVPIYAIRAIYDKNSQFVVHSFMEMIDYAAKSSMDYFLSSYLHKVINLFMTSKDTNKIYNYIALKKKQQGAKAEVQQTSQEPKSQMSVQNIPTLEQKENIPINTLIVPPNQVSEQPYELSL